MRALAAILSSALLGCGTHAAPAHEREPVPETVPSEEPAPEEPQEPEEPAPPRALSDAELDAMDDSELQAACFAGSTAACDRLGH